MYNEETHTFLCKGRFIVIVKVKENGWKYTADEKVFIHI
jgi:hypothetical protein